MKSKKNLILVFFIGAILVFLAEILFHSYGPKGSISITNRDSKPIYTWKSAAIRTVGSIYPDHCALTTTNQHCTCNLSDKNPECIFSFNFENLSSKAEINTEMQDSAIRLMTVTKSSDCSDTGNKLYNCSITLKKAIIPKVGSEDIRIILDGPKGKQTLVSLNVHVE